MKISQILNEFSEGEQPGVATTAAQTPQAQAAAQAIQKGLAVLQQQSPNFDASFNTTDAIQEIMPDGTVVMDSNLQPSALQNVRKILALGGGANFKVTMSTQTIPSATGMNTALQAKPGVAEGDRPFRGVGGAFNRGDDERHDLDPTDWYIVKDGKMLVASIYPRQTQQAIAQGFSRTRAEAKSRDNSQGVAEGNKQLDELFEPTLNYYTLSNGKKVQVSYRPNTNQSPVPFTDVTVSYVDPALKPMGPSFDSTGVAQPWTSAPDGVKQAIQKFATQSSQGVAEASDRMQRYGQQILKRKAEQNAAAQAAGPQPKKEEPPASSDYDSMSTRDFMKQLRDQRRPKKKGVAEGSQLNELAGYASDNKYKHLGSHKRYDVYVSKQKFNNLFFIAIAENPRTLEAKFKTKGNNPEEAVNNLKLEIDKEIDVATKVSGHAILDFNVDFVKDILELSTDVFYAKIVAGPKLVIAGRDMMEYPEIMRDDGFKSSAIRTYKGGEGTTKLPGVPLSAKSAAASSLIANGRYVLGDETSDKDGNRVFDLKFDSVVHASNEKIRLRAPALTVGTNRSQGVTEAPTSVAVRLGRAIERTQGKTAASQARSIIPSSIPKKEEPKKDEKKVDEGIQAGDGFIIECGDSAIETVVLGHYNDGILIEFDHTATFMLTDAGITLTEAEYQGRTVPLGKRMAGDVKKSKVYVKKPNGNVVKVNFGDKNMTIKKHLPKHRKSYRARHHCENPGPKWKANYWSCRAW